MNEELCLCGQPLHYKNRAKQIQVEKIVAQFGPMIKVTCPAGSYMVPRHFIGLHGLNANDLPELAAKYNLKKV